VHASAQRAPRPRQPGRLGDRLRVRVLDGLPVGVERLGEVAGEHDAAVAVHVRLLGWVGHLEASRRKWSAAVGAPTAPRIRSSRIATNEATSPRATPDRGCRRSEPSPTIASYSSTAAVFLAPVPVVGELAEGVAITSGGLAAVRNYREGNYVSSAFDAAGVGFGSVAFKYTRIAKELPELEMVGSARGTVIQLGSEEAAVVQYSAAAYRDNTGLKAYYERLGRTFDIYGANAADTSYLLEKLGCA